jgi:probable F420-dependent oxidoreductase
MDYALGVGGPLPMIGAMAKAIEDAGFESCWAAETTHTAFIPCSEAIRATTKLNVGTAITLAFPRSPTITAMEAADLDELSGGRFILGLGTQVKRINEERFSVKFEHPVPKLKEYAQAMRVVWAANRGDDVTFEGEFYKVTRPTFGGRRKPAPRDIPIYFAAVGKYMARACGEVADGLLAHPIASPKYLSEVIRPEMERGLEKAGRKLADCNLTASPLISISDDEDAARREVKLQIAFYATTRTYSAILELHGKGDLVPDLRAAFEKKDHERMIELIDDELLDEMAIAGRPDEIRDRVKPWESIADRLMTAPPWYGTTFERMLENGQALIEIFGKQPV